MGNRSGDGAGGEMVSPFLSVRIQDDNDDDEDTLGGLQGANWTQAPSSRAGGPSKCTFAWGCHPILCQLCSARSHAASVDSKPDSARFSHTMCTRMSAGHHSNARLSNALGLAAGARAQTMQPQQAQYQWGEWPFPIPCAAFHS